MHSVQISEELSERLAAVMQQTHRTESSYVQQALEQLLEDEEDYLLALSRRGGPGPNVPLEEIERRLGLDSKA